MEWWVEEQPTVTVSFMVHVWFLEALYGDAMRVKSAFYFFSLRQNAGKRKSENYPQSDRVSDIILPFVLYILGRFADYLRPVIWNIMEITKGYIHEVFCDFSSHDRNMGNGDNS